MRPTPAELLRKAHASAFLVTNATHIGYLLKRSPIQGHLLVQASGLSVFTYLPFLNDQQQLRRQGVALYPSADLSVVLRAVKEISLETSTLSIGDLSDLKKKLKNKKIVQQSGIIEEFRRAKDQNELRLIHRACRITRTMLRRVPRLLRPDAREIDIMRQLHIWAMELGADDMAFDPIVGFGPHTSRPHHEPTTRRLREQDIVQIDVGVKANGYCSDFSRVYFVGKPKPEWRQALRVVREAHDSAISAVAPGASTQKLDRLARGIIEEAGMGDAFCHGLGHGVGLEIHEGISLSQKSPDKRLLKNEVITIEPGVYFPGKFGVRWEDTVIVT